MADIDYNTPIPLYYQLKKIIKDQILQGTWQPGSRIPTEDELCQEYGISRTPVRQALSELVREGLLVRTPGRGTFVVHQGKEKGLSAGKKLSVVYSDARWRNLLERATAVYNSGHPENPLTLETHRVPLWDIHDFLVTAVGQGDAPDISVLDSVWVAEFANQHYLVPFDEANPEWYRSLEASAYPAMLAANRFQNRLYGMPVCGDIAVLWYRKDWFTAEGLLPPFTWDDLLSVAGHFHQEPVRERYQLGAYPLVFVGGRRGGETTTYQLLPLLWAAGGELIAEDRVLLNSPDTRRTLSFLRALINEHRLVPPDVVEYTWDHAAQVFAAGHAALAFGGTYESFFIREIAGWDEAEFIERVGFVPLPAGPGGEPASLVGGMNYVLYRQSQMIQESLTMLGMSVEPEILAPFCVRTGQIPAITQMALALSREDSGFVSKTIPLLGSARTRPSLPTFARVSAQFRALIEDCLTGQQPIDQAVSLAAQRISAIADLPIE